MICANCGAELLRGKQFCHSCGAPAKAVCPACGAEVGPGFRFCPDCGHALAPGPSAPPDQGRDLARLAREMPLALAEKIRASREAIEGERKQVTVLFCDLAGSTAVADRIDAEEYRELLERYLELAILEVYRFEGIINQLAGDGFMALFGAPVAHEDAPQRAVRAAIAIRGALARFNEELQDEQGFTLPARIGIHTGLVVVGTVGNDMKMDYTAIGDTTNLAARLESLAAPGTILVSEATARLVRGFFDLCEIGPLAVKGKSEPIPAYVVGRPTGAESPIAVAAARGLTPLVGRDEELAQLEACFLRLGGNLAQVVSVTGDAGMGKSRLLHEFKQHLVGQDVELFEARCSALNQNEAYYPFVGMLRQYFALGVDDSADAMCDKVARRLGTAATKIDAEYPLLCRLLSVPVGSVVDAPPDELKRQTFDAVANLVMHASRQKPVVMILEDLHWIDEPSRDLIELAVSRLARVRVMVLVSHRPDYRPVWKTAAAVTQLSLRPLADEEIARILAAVAGATLPEQVERLVLGRAEGSPFFGEEIIRTLIEEGYVTVGDDGSCRATRPVEEMRIPGTVQEVLAARLDRLEPAAKRVAQVAAVFGRQFDRTHLEQILEPEGIDVAGELDELERRGVIHRKSLFSAEEYRFGESLTQEVAYESLLLKQRRLLHERIGLLLEGSARDGEAARPAVVAHHFALSDNRDKALETLLRAAREAEKLPSYGSALEFYRRAWQRADQGEVGGKVAEWLVEATLGYARVTVLYGASDDPEALRAVECGRTVAETLGANEALAGFYAYEGMMRTGHRDRFADGLRLVERAVEVAEGAELVVSTVSISRALAWGYLLDARFAPAREKIDWVLAELERLGQGTELSDLYLGARWMSEGVSFYSGDFERALGEARENYELSLKASNRTTQSSSASSLAHSLFVRDELEEAKRWADRGLELGEAIGSVGAIHRGAVLALATRVALGGSFNPARYVDLIDTGLRIGGNLLLCGGIVVETLLSLGDLERAERFARTAHAQAAGRLREMLAATALADVETRFGPSRWAEAERLYGEVLDAASTLRARAVLAWAALGAGRLATERGRAELAATHLEKARAFCRELGMRRYEREAEKLLEDLRSGSASTGPVQDAASG